MAARTLEATFERMTVNDENDTLGEGSKSYSKTKVRRTDGRDPGVVMPSESD